MGAGVPHSALTGTLRSGLGEERLKPALHPPGLSCLLWEWTEAASGSKARAGSDMVHVPTESTRRYFIRSAPAEHSPASAFSWSGHREFESAFPLRVQSSARSSGEGGWSLTCVSSWLSLPIKPYGEEGPQVVNTLMDVSVTSVGKYPHMSPPNKYEQMLSQPGVSGARGRDGGRGGEEVQASPRGLTGEPTCPYLHFLG